MGTTKHYEKNEAQAHKKNSTHYGPEVSINISLENSNYARKQPFIISFEGEFQQNEIILFKIGLKPNNLS